MLARRVGAAEEHDQRLGAAGGDERAEGVVEQSDGTADHGGTTDRGPDWAVEQLMQLTTGGLSHTFWGASLVISCNSSVLSAAIARQHSPQKSSEGHLKTICRVASRRLAGWRKRRGGGQCISLCACKHACIFACRWRACVQACIFTPLRARTCVRVCACMRACMLTNSKHSNPRTGTRKTIAATLGMSLRG